ncbi:MAG: glycine cleavage system protein GcvH [Thermoplasmata archaeon]
MTGTPTPTDRRYAPSHEWAKVDGSEVTVGITDHAQSELTDIVFVELPAEGKPVAKGASVLVLESVKTVADVYAPVSGTLLAVNGELKTHPELINQDPYGRGWLFRIRSAAVPDLGDLLDAGAYDALASKGG